MSGLCQKSTMSYSIEKIKQYNLTPEQRGELVGSLNPIEDKIIKEVLRIRPPLAPLRGDIVLTSQSLEVQTGHTKMQPFKFASILSYLSALEFFR